MNATAQTRPITRNDLPFLQARMRQEILRGLQARKQAIRDRSARPIAILCGHCGTQASPCACDPRCLVAEISGLF